MFFTQKNLIDVLKAMGFRNMKVRYNERPENIEITVSGFGRFRRLEPMAVVVFRRDKPIMAKVKITRKFFGFRLWEIEI